VKPVPRVDSSTRVHLRLAPPLDDNTPQSLGLSVGDLAVYASHGVGRVESTQPSRKDPPETLTLVFESGLRVTLPAARARDALRPLSGPDELEAVRRTLSADVSPTNEPWSSRHRTLRQTVAAGTILGLAEVVRDGVQREWTLAAGTGRPPAPSERELYLKARHLLAAEIAACRGIETAAADAWIIQQISGENAQT
jgi:RNA polymerase-interacting CarD/CdnL/TRCF family regulator